MSLRMDYLERANNKLNLRLALLEPIVGRMARFDSRLSSLEEHLKINISSSNLAELDSLRGRLARLEEKVGHLPTPTVLPVQMSDNELTNTDLHVPSPSVEVIPLVKDNNENYPLLITVVMMEVAG